MKQMIPYWRMVVVLVFALVGWTIVDHIYYVKQTTAVCAVLAKHIPNRSPQVVGGECGMLTGVEEPRVWMSVEDYGRDILESEK